MPYEDAAARRAFSLVRIGELSVAVFLPGALSPPAAEMLECVVRSCPVHNTLVHGAAVSVSIEEGAADHAVLG